MLGMTPQAATLTRTSLGRGVGMSISSIWKAEPTSYSRAARMVDMRTPLLGVGAASAYAGSGPRRLAWPAEKSGAWLSLWAKGTVGGGVLCRRHRRRPDRERGRGRG